MRPLITIAICTRNRSALLHKAVRRVLPQLTDCAEVLIVDNGSTDETTRLAAKFPLADPRVKFSFEPALAFCSTLAAPVRRIDGLLAG